MPEPVKLLQNLLDYCSVKNKVISKNIANLSTQGYKREDVEFKDFLNDNVNSLMRTTDSRHIRFVDPEENQSAFKVVSENSGEMSSGYNNVNIDEEMTDMAENSLKFRFASKKMAEYFKMMQGVIKGGGGF